LLKVPKIPVVKHEKADYLKILSQKQQKQRHVQEKMRDIKNMIAHKMIVNQTASLDFKNGQLPGTDSVIQKTNGMM